VCKKSGKNSFWEKIGKKEKRLESEGKKGKIRTQRHSIELETVIKNI
jgi:hypothetical protein